MKLQSIPVATAMLASAAIIVWLAIPSSVVPAQPLASLRAEPLDLNLDLDLPPPTKTEERKLQTPLARLSAALRGYGQPGAEVVARSMALPLENGRVRVIAEAQPGRAGEMSQRAASLGIPPEATYRDLVQLLVPVGLLETLAQDPAVAFVRLPLSRVALGSIPGQGVSVIGADDWQAAGLTGAGTKVAILDLGFDGYQALLGTELPNSVVTHSCRADSDITGGGAEHGTAVAEIVHEVAPDAQLYLANFDTGVELADCVAWLKSQGVHVVNFSIISFATGPGDGTGFLNDIVNSATAQGILWVNAAGNQAQGHWMGPWNDPDGDDYHNFSVAPKDESNAIFALAGDVITVIIKWDDPFGTSCNDYDLGLIDPTETTFVAFSVNFQDFCTSGLPSFPVEFISYTVPASGSGTYHVVITRFDADGTANFHLYSLNPFHQCPTGLQYCVKSGSILEPGDNPNVLTAGAVRWNTPDTIEFFSSRGPTDDGRIKPDLVAPDGVSNASINPFFGTSAAAPHTAGAAALVKQWQPGWSQDQIRSFLLSRAVDLGVSGADNVFGEGRLNLDAPKTPTPTATGTPTPTPTLTPCPAGKVPADGGCGTPTPIPTHTPTPTATPTKQPAGDTDGDGCTDAQENGPNAGLGGRRDYLSFWDFMDVYTGEPPVRDKIVSVGDIGGVVARFATSRESPPTKEEALVEALTPPTDLTSYHPAFDRNGSDPEGNVWDLFPPDGIISVGDIGAVVGQFGHTCA